MTLITIRDDIDKEHTIEENLDSYKIEGYVILNTKEIGTTIAYQLFDREELYEEDIHEEVNDFMANIDEKIFESAIECLEANGIEVK